MAQAHIEARRKRVSELAAQRKTINEIASALAAEGITNPQTGKPYSATTVRSDVHAGAGTAVKEMVGRVVIGYNYHSRVPRSVLTVDKTQTDYQAYDKLRRGKLKGFEISGLFCQPITQILTAFELGSGVTLTLADGGDANDENDPRTYTDRQLERFTSENHALFLQAEEDKLALGDQYIIVNPDGTLSVASPDTVELEHDELDYRKLTKITIRTKLEKAEVTDEYTATERVVTVKRTDKLGQAPEVRRYANLIGEIPIVHWANDRSANELYGRPVYEALFFLFSRYDDLLRKALDGAELLGNPVPTITGVDAPEQVFDANATPEAEEYSDREGSAVTREVVAFDRNAMMILGTGADFKMVSPQRGFTQDVSAMLDELLTLMLMFTRIPELMVGSAIQASKASTETQMPPFIEHVRFRRQKLTPDYYDLARIWLKTKRLIDPRIVVDRLRATFPEISLEDAQITLQKLIWLRGMGDITRLTSLSKLHIVPDPAKEIQLAQEEHAELMAQQENYQAMLNQVARRDADPASTVPTPQRTRMNVVPPLPAGGRRPRMNDGTRVGEITGVDPEIALLESAERGDVPRRKRPRKRSRRRVEQVA